MQADLFTAPYQRHSETSRAAAERIQPKLNALQQRVLYMLKKRGPLGATDEEICDALQLGQSTGRPRRIELVKMNLARDSGRKRKTKSGSPATVWEAA